MGAEIHDPESARAVGYLDEVVPAGDLIARATVGTECEADCRCWHCEQFAAAQADSDALDWLRRTM